MRVPRLSEALSAAGVLAALAMGAAMGDREEAREEPMVPSWAPGEHKVGDRVQWLGVVLVCCTAHTSVKHMEQPWETIGWHEQKAAALWAPDGEVEAARLAALVQEGLPDGLERPEALRACALIAAGQRS